MIGKSLDNEPIRLYNQGKEVKPDENMENQS